MSIEIKISKKRIPYKIAMLYLNKRVEEVKSDKNRELLWILEHPTTYTAGVSFNKKEIIDKINSFFGYNCISHITLKIAQNTIKIKRLYACTSSSKRFST